MYQKSECQQSQDRLFSLLWESSDHGVELARLTWLKINFQENKFLNTLW